MKRIIALTILFTGLFVAAIGQETPNAPIISSKAKGHYRKVHSQLNSAEAKFEEKQQKYKSVIADMLFFCGKGFQLQLLKDGKLDKDGDPTCVALPSAETPKK